VVPAKVIDAVLVPPVTVLEKAIDTVYEVDVDRLGTFKVTPDLLYAS
jgi:hypothetical protein